MWAIESDYRIRWIRDSSGETRRLLGKRLVSVKKHNKVVEETQKPDRISGETLGPEDDFPTARRAGVPDGGRWTCREVIRRM